MRPFFVVNPASANGQTGRRWAELEAMARRVLGDDFGKGFTESRMHASALARRAAGEGYDTIIAVGGDGTLNEVVNGLLDGDHPVAPGIAIAILPRGTGGDFCRTLELDAGHPGKALERLREGRRRALDIGRLELTAESGGTRVRYFVNECSLGLSGQVVHEVNRSSKALGGKVTFLWGTAKSIVRYTDRKVRVSMDGGPFEEMGVTSLIVANGRFFGGGMCVAPTADAFDGVFDVTLWSGYGLVDLLRYQGRMFDGTHVSLRGTRTFRCKELRAEAVDERAVLLDCDGEQPGKLPCRIQMLRGAIDLIG